MGKKAGNGNGGAQQANSGAKHGNVKITWVHGGRTESVTVPASAAVGRIRQLKRNSNYSNVQRA